MSDNQTNTEDYMERVPSSDVKLAGCIIAVVVVCLVATVWMSTQAAAVADSDEPSVVLTKATLMDCTSTDENNSLIDSSAVLLEGLSFVQGNPYFLNPRGALQTDFSLPLYTTSYVEKIEFSYDTSNRVKTATAYKSTNALADSTFSYDSHGCVSKIVGYTTVDSVQDDFEISNVNEALSSSAYGVNKTTVVHGDLSENDTVLYTYDKDKNLTDIVSSGGHPWHFRYTYNTSYKYTTQAQLSFDGKDAGIVLVPVYDGNSNLVSLSTGTFEGDDITMEDNEYEIQYSKGHVSKIHYYEERSEVRYYDFSYDSDGNLTSIRVYKNGGGQLYNITFSWSAV